jgi:SAM-dependent methyltransferase
MNEVADHYRQLLAPIYLWMAGGPDGALIQGAADLALLGVAAASGSPALDLGAGFGMHAIPLARLGYRVTAVDSSALLLQQLRELSGGLAIRVIEGDLLDFEPEPTASPALVLCMGDTLTHLANAAVVGRLCSRVARLMAAGGRFVTTFRDYTLPARGNARFIPVRSDADRIHTCFLEEHGEHMLVHDIVHERQHDGAWSLRVGRYPKLRLDPDQVVQFLEHAGLRAHRQAGPRGLVQISAVKTG